MRYDCGRPGEKIKSNSPRMARMLILNGLFHASNRMSGKLRTSFHILMKPIGGGESFSLD